MGGLVRALSSGDRCQLLHQRLEAGWRKHARVVTREDGPQTLLDDPVPLPASQDDVEAIVADGCQHLTTDACPGPERDRALARSALRPAAPALGHRHVEPFDYEESYWDRREALNVGVYPDAARPLIA